METTEDKFFKYIDDAITQLTALDRNVAGYNNQRKLIVEQCSDGICKLLPKKLEKDFEEFIKNRLTKATQSDEATLRGVIEQMLTGDGVANNSDSSKRKTIKKYFDKTYKTRDDHNKSDDVVEFHKSKIKIVIILFIPFVLAVIILLPVLIIHSLVNIIIKKLSARECDQMPQQCTDKAIGQQNIEKKYKLIHNIIKIIMLPIIIPTILALIALCIIFSPLLIISCIIFYISLAESVDIKSTSIARHNYLLDEVKATSKDDLRQIY
ncbi:MAG: hypothetical protein OEY79_04360 [Anaplasmataceae bacterium]|nr:hypothetical protein [Anaplasmataceae bacterium]